MISIIKQTIAEYLFVFSNLKLKIVPTTSMANNIISIRTLFTRLSKVISAINSKITKARITKQLLSKSFPIPIRNPFNFINFTQNGKFVS